MPGVNDEKSDIGCIVPVCRLTRELALVHVSALANVTCQACYALKKAFCGIGLSLTLMRRRTSTSP
eukprot:12377020-Prorocentrum_lima.AAC.1